jgi:hypothetical protein
MAFPTFKPALRLVTSGGSVMGGPNGLYQPNVAGIFLTSAACEYVPELLGPWQNLSYQTRWRLLGYRVRVALSFGLLMADNASGFEDLHAYYVAGLQGETYAALQFNLYSLTSPTWRGMIVTTPWSPKPARGKQRAGYELDLTLEARDLITAPGNWADSDW